MRECQFIFDIPDQWLLKFRTNTRKCNAGDDWFRMLAEDSQ